MGIFYCTECEGKVSSQLEACPHCGCPIIAKTKAPQKESLPDRKPAKLAKGLIRCSGCDCLVRESMGMCSQCGTLLTPEAEVAHIKNVRSPRIILYPSQRSLLVKAGAVLLVVIVCVVIFSDDSSSVSKRNEKIISKNKYKKSATKNKSSNYAKIQAHQKLYGDPIDAWVSAQVIIKRYLKSPGTADFGGWFDQTAATCVADLGNGEYFVKGWVDSQNGFGALIRSNFMIKLKFISEYNYQIIEGPAIE